MENNINMHLNELSHTVLNRICNLFLQNLRSVKRSHDTLLMEMENVNMQVKEEQNRNLALHNELKLGSTKQSELIQVGWGLHSEI